MYLYIEIELKNIEGKENWNDFNLKNIGYKTIPRI